jgi:hypothetical protein
MQIKVLPRVLLVLLTLLIVAFFAWPSNTEATPNSALLFQSPLPPPSNDNFAAAIRVPVLPFSHVGDVSSATRQGNEPPAECTGAVHQTVWYRFKANHPRIVLTDLEGSSDNTTLSVYRQTGSGLGGLQFINCIINEPFFPGERVQFFAEPNVTYFIRAGVYDTPTPGAIIQVNLARLIPPPPSVFIDWSPFEPSTYDIVEFFGFVFDPAFVGITSETWDFGDGATAQGCCPTHQYAADGDYQVTLTVTTLDGRTASDTETIQVRTRDVAITKFVTPKSGRVGRTSQIVVGINNRLNPETVRVEIYSSRPGGFQQFGFLTQFVPVRAGNRTTDFTFNYTFTPADAAIGKVSFRAIAIIEDGPDALPGDNEAISFPIKVKAITAASGDEAEETETQDRFLVRSQMDEDAEIRDLFQLPTHYIFLPLVADKND